jgi:hypothetical protein
MKIIQNANKVARENAKAINRVIKRDAKRVGSVVKILTGANLNVTYVYVDSGSYNISVVGTRADLDIMFGLLRRAGLTPRSRPQEKESIYTTWWTWEDGNTVWVSFSSTSCKRVKVGTEMKEVDVYETVCED